MVIDFGVAKAIGRQLTEKTMFTEFGQVVGTTEYMSPEQASSASSTSTRDPTSIRWACCCTNCWPARPLSIASGCRAQAFDEMQRIIREEGSPNPSTRLSSSDGLPPIAARRSVEPQKLPGWCAANWTGS